MPSFPLSPPPPYLCEDEGRWVGVSVLSDEEVLEEVWEHGGEGVESGGQQVRAAAGEQQAGPGRGAGDSLQLPPEPAGTVRQRAKGSNEGNLIKLFPLNKCIKLKYIKI